MNWADEIFGIHKVHAPLRKDTDRHQTISELLAVLVDTKARGDLQQGVDVTA